MRAAAVSAALLLGSATASGQTGWSGTRPDARLPQGLQGHYEMSRGELALSYQYDREYYRDYRFAFLGSILEPVPAEDFLEFYPTVPERMTQQVHVVGAAFVPLDGLVLTAALPVHRSSMEVITADGDSYSQSSSGIGDLSIHGSYRVLAWSRQRFDVEFAAGVPTGSLDPADTTIDALPYPMRVASGTWSWSPGFTYQGQVDGASWGFQLFWTIPAGANARNYRLGSGHYASTWLAGKWGDWVSSSVRLAYRSWGPVVGSDPALDPENSPLERPELMGGRYIDGWIGTNLSIPSGPLAGQRLSLEVGYPLYIEANTLRSRWYLTAGWQYAFRVFGG